MGPGQGRPLPCLPALAVLFQRLTEVPVVEELPASVWSSQPQPNWWTLSPPPAAHRHWTQNVVFFRTTPTHCATASPLCLSVCLLWGRGLAGRGTPGPAPHGSPWGGTRRRSAASVLRPGREWRAVGATVRPGEAQYRPPASPQPLPLWRMDNEMNM